MAAVDFSASIVAPSLSFEGISSDEPIPAGGGKKQATVPWLRSALCTDHSLKGQAAVLRHQTLDDTVPILTCARTDLSERCFQEAVKDAWQFGKAFWAACIALVRKYCAEYFTVVYVFYSFYF